MVLFLLYIFTTIFKIHFFFKSGLFLLKNATALCFVLGVWLHADSRGNSEARAGDAQWASEGRPKLFWRPGGRKFALLMSNDCGFLANIKEEGTKNTYRTLCQNSAALRTYQANM